MLVALSNVAIGADDKLPKVPFDWRFDLIGQKLEQRVLHRDLIKTQASTAYSIVIFTTLSKISKFTLYFSFMFEQIVAMSSGSCPSKSLLGKAKI